MIPLGRVYKTRALLGAIIIIAFIVVVHQNFIKGNGGKIRLPGGDLNNGVMGKAEFNEELAQVEKCPVCLGTEMCSDLARSNVDVSRATYAGVGGDQGRPLRAGVHQVYTGSSLKYVVRPVSSWPLLQGAMESFEAAVCRNSSVKDAKNCNAAVAAESSFLFKSNFGEDTIHNVYKSHLVSRRRIPMTACPSYKLTQGLVQAFDANGDNTLTPREKAVLITSVATFPDAAANRFILHAGIRIPKLGFYGACGRVLAVEGGYKPLSDYMEQSLEVRKGLAAQLLKLLEILINEDANWMLVTTDITMDNLVVTTGGDVVFHDLNQVMFIDRDMVDEDDANDAGDEKECDFQCLWRFFEDLVEGSDKTGCYQMGDRAEIMFALACRNVLSDMAEERKIRPKSADQRGLLHSMVDEDELEEVNSLIRGCVDETQKSGRLEATMNLAELLLADFNDAGTDDEGFAGDEDIGSEQDYDDGNVVHGDGGEDAATGGGTGGEDKEDEKQPNYHDDDNGDDDDEEDEADQVNPSKDQLPADKVKLE